MEPPIALRSEYAALVNGTFGHGFELDEHCTPCGAHVGCVVLPAALAVGKKGVATGADFLAAFALGAETVIRVGFAFTVRGIAARGFHSTSVYGPFGGAVGWQALENESEMTYAIGIAGSHCSGTTEYDQTGGDIKRLHAGIAGMAGIWGAYLAKKGFTAPPTILEGKNGMPQSIFQQSHGGKTDGLFGRRFFDACHPDQALRLLRRHYSRDRCGEDRFCRSIRFKPAEVKQITVGVENRALSHVGTVGPEPKDITGAQISSHFSLGLTIAKGSNDFQSVSRRHEQWL